MWIENVLLYYVNFNEDFNTNNINWNSIKLSNDKDPAQYKNITNVSAPTQKFEIHGTKIYPY